LNPLLLICRIVVHFYTVVESQGKLKVCKISTCW